ncbi:MAG: hypothetical protein IPH35_18100 [Rhodoferax sp.]|nr:hypothetical protein [Rhodoferax sp.]
MESTNDKLCKHCGKPVVATLGSYDVQEQMHWLCFHLLFEHEGAPDRPCDDPSCPWWHIAAYESKLSQIGIDPKQVISEAIDEKWKPN